MSEQENVKVAQTFFDNINAHDLSRNNSFQGDGYTFEGPGTAGPVNWEQGQQYTQGFITAFPDLHFDMPLTVAQGDHVVVNWIGTGTQDGPLTTPTGNTIPPTGKKVRVPGSSTFEIKNGKVTRAQTFWDMASLLGQLGLMPPM